MQLIGQGKVSLAVATAGVPAGFDWLGNVDSFSPAFASETIEKRESYTGLRGVIASVTRGTTGTLSLTCTSFDPAIVAIAAQSAKSAKAGATVTAEALPTGILVGQTARLANFDVSAVVVKDSAGSPATLVAGTDYAVNAKSGSIEFKNLGSYVQPFKVDYTYAAHAIVPFMTAAAKEFWVRFEGINLADNNKAVVAEFYKVKFSPLTQIPMIGEDFASFEMQGQILADETKTDSTSFGQYGRLVYVDE